ncbi:hypothetical protein [Oceanirhabdus sp. W0125-5]|uniref:hypothetical protein n=1 Tax=Oceanirhabdus sp. W0125-5 TaxID=2999116 RepID=UPI0022F32712|nr:hypothetical protein [Oceanirhabdus sp. W0125-5]WBW97694.1 hypothetical protein OW730_02635 [Oceanirhabdus sp. W0125-5]
MKKIISFLLLGLMIISLNCNVVYAQNLRKSKNPTEQEIRDYLKDYYENSKNKKNKNTPKSRNTSDEEILKIQDFITYQKNLNENNILMSLGSPLVPDIVHDPIPTSLFTGKTEFSNKAVVGDNFAYVADRIGYAGGTATMITSIAFFDKALNVGYETLENGTGTWVDCQFTYVDSYVIAYNTYDETYMVLAGGKPVENLTIAVGSTDPSSLVYYVRGVIYGTDPSFFGVKNVACAFLARFPLTSATYYAFQELTNNITNSYDLDADKMTSQEKIFPSTLEGQQNSYSLNEPVYSVGLNFKSRILDRSDQYALTKVKFNKYLSKSKIVIYIKAGY